MNSITQHMAEYLPSFSCSWITENAENCFPSYFCPSYLRKKIFNFLIFKSQIHNGPPAKYSQNLRLGSLGSQDPAWQISQDAEDLISSRAGLLSITLGSSWTVNQPKPLLAEKAPQTTAGTLSFSQNTLVLMDWHILWKSHYIRKFSGNRNSQSTFRVA